MDSRDFSLAVDLGREALLVAVKLSLPILLSGLVVGTLISVVQAATQVQEQTLTQVPKTFVVAAVVFVALPWLLAVLVEYSASLIANMGGFFR
jgi:flagellar biosynthetic protein FliQ